MSLSDCPPSFKLVKLGNPDAERDALNAGIQAMLRCMGANSLPDPTGHAGEYLTTDGSTFSWAPAGGGSGTVTSVGVSTGSSGVSVTGSPVTTSGTIDLDLGTLANVDDAPSDGTTYGRLNGAWAAAGGGGSTPTGTGFTHITAGVQDAAAKLVNLTATTDVAANQGTTTTVLHGNAAGQPSFASVNLASDVSGDLPYANLVQATAASRLLVRGSAGGAGDWQEGTLGTGLSFTGTVLNATATPPGGSTTQIQYNDTGAFAGSAGLAWDDANQQLLLGGADTSLLIKGITNEPTTPSTGNIVLYSKNISGRLAMKIKGPSGISTPLQNAFWQNRIVMWNPTTATAGVWLGTAGAGAGTYSTALPTDTNQSTSIKRSRWANVVTTTNQVLGQRNTEAMFYRGSGVSGAGGFFMFARGGFDVFTSGSRFFCGMATGTTVISANPSALNNTVGFCVDSTDGLAISFLTRSISATKAATGFSFATTNSMFDFYIFCASGSSEYSWRIVSLNSGTEASGVATANLPANTTKLTANFLGSNAALTPVTSTQISLNRLYIETDT